MFNNLLALLFLLKFKSSFCLLLNDLITFDDINVHIVQAYKDNDLRFYSTKKCNTTFYKDI